MTLPTQNSLLPPAGEPARLPALGSPEVTPEYLARMKEILETLLGRRGSADWDRAVTLRDLYSMGLRPGSGNTWIIGGDVAGAGVSIPAQQAIANQVREEIERSAAFRNLKTRIGSAEDYAHLPDEIRRQIALGLQTVARERQADLRTVEQKIQTVDVSMASRLREITASLERTAAGVRQFDVAYADRTQAIALQLTQLTARLDDVGGITVEEKLSAIADEVDGLQGQWSVKIQTDDPLNPVIAGIALSVEDPIAGPGTSSLVFMSERFAFVTNNGTIMPFVLDSAGMSLNGMLRVNGMPIADIASGAKRITLRASSQLFQIPKSGGAADPGSITLTADTLNLAGTPNFTIPAGTATLSAGANANSKVLTFANMTTDTVTIQVTQDGMTDTVTIVKVREGADSINAFLTNEQHTLTADKDGVVSDLTGAGTAIKIYRGAVDESASWAYSFAPPSSAASLSYTTSPDGSLAVAGMAAAVNSAYVDITATRAGFSNIVKRFTINKAKAGDRGADGVRGTVDIAVATTGSVWSSAEADAGLADAGFGAPRFKDIVTLYNGAAKFSQTRFYDGAGWIQMAAYFNGNMLIDGTVAASKIVTNGLVVRDLDGNPILSMGGLQPGFEAPGTKNSDFSNGTLNIGGDNLTPNSSFEKAVNHLATEFGIYNNGGSGEPTTAGTGVGRNGSGRSQIIAWTGSHWQTKGIYGQMCKGGWLPGKTYVISFYAKTTSLATVGGMTSEWNVYPAALAWLLNPNLSTEWQRYALRITMGAQVEAGGVSFLSVHTGDGPGNVHFDDLMVTEGEVLTAYKPSTAEALADAAAANEAIATISNDNVISKSEKSSENIRWQAVYNEHGAIYDRATSLGLISQRDAYYATVTELSSYVNTVDRFGDSTVDTPINGEYYRTLYANYATQKSAVLAAIDGAAAATAQWVGVSDRPTDNAIYNDRLALQPDGRLLDNGIWRGQIQSIPTVDLGSGTHFGARNRNDNPADYAWGTIRQFKESAALLSNNGLAPPGADGYGTLDTIKQYQDASGGGVHQYFYSGLKTFRRYAADPASTGGQAAWSPWVLDLDRNSYTGDLDATRDVALVGYNHVAVRGNTASKVAGSPTAWDSQAQSKDGFVGGAYASAKLDNLQITMFGLNTDPDSDASFASIDFAIYGYNDGSIHAYASGSPVASNIGVYVVGDVLGVIYDGSKVYYLQNGRVLYTHTPPAPVTAPLYFDSSFHLPATSLSNIRFGPLSSNNWNSVGGAGKPSDNATANLTLIGRGVQVQGNFLKKTYASNDWDADAYSKESSPYAYASATVTDLNSRVFFGLNDNPLYDAHWADIFLSFLLDGGGVAYTGVNASLTHQFTVAVGDALLITYDGVNARWYKNGTLLRTSAYDTAGVPLYFDSSFASIGGTLANCQFGPVTSALWAHQGGAGKPQDNATYGAPPGTIVGNNYAENVDLWAQQGANANNAIPGINTAIGERLRKAGNDAITGQVALQSAYALLVGTSNDGVYYGNSGLVGRKGGYTTFSISADGTATFAGSLIAASGTLGSLHIAGGGGIHGGAYTSYAWPEAGNTGFYIGPEGFKCGSGNRYFNADQYGDVYAPDFTIVNGVATFSGRLGNVMSLSLTDNVASNRQNANEATVNVGTMTVNIANGRAPHKIQWAITSVSDSPDWRMAKASLENPESATVTLKVSCHNDTSAQIFLTCTVVDADGKTASINSYQDVHFGGYV